MGIKHLKVPIILLFVLALIPFIVQISPSHGEMLQGTIPDFLLSDMTPEDEPPLPPQGTLPPQATLASQVVESLILSLQDSHWKVRRDTATALGKIKDKKSVTPLIETLKDKNPDVRVAVVLALGEIGDQQALEKLTAMLKDEDAAVATVAVEATKKIELIASGKTSNK
ncbi:MAG: HEAT repeat domain-containing protein [Nitrospirae bacterium]|nr:HEAT repeat domain-containing protein [Candidatus Troglogloeales bacterium]MBI3598391.1 HEAT repeat domain-containing protein [Candidatus Troglogloeales bacterium]